MPFLSSTPSNQNLKFIKKCPSLSSLKSKFEQLKNQVLLNSLFWPLIRKVLTWIFWVIYGPSSYHLSQSSPVCYWRPLLRNLKNKYLGSVLPFIQRSLSYRQFEILRVQVILFEIDWTIFYTNLRELFCKFISWTNWVNSGWFMDNCWISCQVMADMKKVYDDLIFINL